MSFADVIERLTRPLRPELYIGCRYQFFCQYDGRRYSVTGHISNLLYQVQGQAFYSVEAKGFRVVEIRALVKDRSDKWSLQIRSGENFTEYVSGTLKIE